jgi:transposase-like protein
MAAARIYRHQVRCPHCGSNWVRKYGRSALGKQRYRCGDCIHYFTPEAGRRFYPQAVKDQAVARYCEGGSIRGVGRALGVPLLTVYGWIKKSPLGPDADAPAATGRGPERAGPGIGFR